MQSRRRYIQQTASVASLGVIGGLAGCSGDGDNGSSGGNGGSSGTSGGDGGGGSFKLTAIPSSPSALVLNHVIESGTLDEKVQEAGYDSVDAQLTWEGPPQFAAGQSDMAVGDMSGIEAARMGAERDIDLSVMGRITSNYVGMLVERGGDYDPENTGDVQATVDAIVEDNANLGIPGWESGSVPPSQIIMQENFGISLAEDGGDLNAISADYGAIPQLLLDGELAMGLTAPPLGAAPNFVEDPPSVKPLYWNSSELIDAGYGVPPLGDVITRQSFADENEEAVSAVLEAYQEGVEWFLEDPVSVATESTDNMEIVGASNEQEAEFIVSWSFDSQENEYAPDWPPFYEDPHATDDWIQQNEEFLASTADIGQIPETWDEHVEYRSVS